MKNNLINHIKIKPKILCGKPLIWNEKLQNLVQQKSYKVMNYNKFFPSKKLEAIVYQ